MGVGGNIAKGRLKLSDLLFLSFYGQEKSEFPNYDNNFNTYHNLSFQPIGGWKGKNLAYILICKIF